jgi:hypothetical protein
MRTTLQTFLKTGRLKEHPTDPAEIAQLLAGAERNLADAGASGISTETRFHAAYLAITQTALAALRAHGFRPDTRRPGHHVTILQTLRPTIGLDPPRIAVLDVLRRKRNETDYTGMDMDEASVAVCIDEARRLLVDVQSWLRANRSQSNIT